MSASAAANEITLSTLLAPWVVVPADNDCLVHGIQLDSRKVSAGEVFIAMAGEVTHGIDYLDDVSAQKAAAVLVDANDPRTDEALAGNLDLPLIEIPDLVRNAGLIVGRFFGDPSRELQVVGVTGTDGKTSLCHLIGQALNGNRDNCGVIGTLGSGFTGDLSLAGLTTPDCVTLQSALAGFRHRGASYVAMEVSSHALAQHRTSGIAIDVAVFTNLGRDHLDYHGDMKSYGAAKESLFYQPQLRAAVINSDDDFGNSLAGRLGDLDVTTYGAVARSGEHVRYHNVSQTSRGLEFDLDFAGQSYAISSGLFGDFNVSNLSAIFAVLVTLGLSPDLAASSICELKAVPGRMEVSLLENGVTVIVDYAHNPHALESVLRSVSSHVSRELVVVFGCGGDRDQGKRPLMAAVAENYGHRCVVTDDNPRNENGDDIVKQIVAGFSESQQVVVERDRKKAILTALNDAQPGDVVVIAGKGHEDYQLIGNRSLPFSDSAVVSEYALELAS